MKNELVSIEKKPVIPNHWNYAGSVKMVKQVIYKWKNITVELVTELWIAREILDARGSNLPNVTNVTNGKTWTRYCKDIGVERMTVHRWLTKYFSVVANATSRIAEEERSKWPQTFNLRKGDFKKVLKDVKEIDAIITDPPYPKEYLSCFSDLSEFASKHLKKDGFLVVYSGQYHLPEVINRLSEHLTYVWTFCLYHVGKKQLVNGVNIMCGWKPVLVFSKGKKKMRFSAYDVLISEAREKASHKWQQSESGVSQLIEIFSRPGDMVVDPFAGSGTFLKVAQELGRKAIGAEIK